MFRNRNKLRGGANLEKFLDRVVDLQNILTQAEEYTPDPKSEPENQKKSGSTSLIVLAAGVLGFIPYLLFSSPFPETERFASFATVFPFLGLVYFIIHDHRKNKTPVYVAILAVAIITPILFLITFGYVIGINGLVKLDERELAGEIVRVFTSGSGGSGSGSADDSLFWVEIRSAELGQNIEVNVQPEVYQDLEVGQQFSDVWNVGLLGLLYK